MSLMGEFYCFSFFSLVVLVCISFGSREKWIKFSESVAFLGHQLKKTTATAPTWNRIFSINRPIYLIKADADAFWTLHEAERIFVRPSHTFFGPFFVAHESLKLIFCIFFAIDMGTMHSYVSHGKMPFGRKISKLRRKIILCRVCRQSLGQRRIASAIQWNCSPFLIVPHTNMSYCSAK